MLIITGANSKSFNTVEINNNAIINIVNSGVTDLNNGTVLNNGNGAELLIDSNGGLIQEGTGGTVNNEGLISKHNNGAPGAFYMIFDTNNHGVIEVQEGQTFLFLTIAADFHNYADGTMTGTGAFDITANFFNEGRVTPGDEGLGTLEIVNNFVMSPGSVLDININGTGTGEFDVLDIFGDPDLAGEIEVQAVLTPDDIGATFPIVLAQLGINSCAFPATVFSINGSEMYSFDVHCNPNDVTLEFTGILLGQEDVTAEGAWGLYPNPSNGEIHILLSELLLSDDVQYTVYNQLGQVLREVKLDETNSTIDLSDLPSGLYFIQPQSNDKRFTAKRVVKI